MKKCKNKLEKFNNKYKDYYLEQYKLIVDVVVRMNDRRSGVNKFYITVLSSLFAFVIAWDKQFSANISPLWVFLLGLFGIALCIIWCLHIRVFKKRSEARYAVIHEMEEKCKFLNTVFKTAGEKEKEEKYIGFTKIERSVPIVFAFIYFFITVYAICKIIENGFSFNIVLIFIN